MHQIEKVMCHPVLLVLKCNVVNKNHGHFMQSLSDNIVNAAVHGYVKNLPINSGIMVPKVKFSSV